MYLYHVIAFSLLIFATGVGVLADREERYVTSWPQDHAADFFEDTRFQGEVAGSYQRTAPWWSGTSPKSHMDFNHVIAFFLIIFATVAGVAVTTFSQRARDVGFFVLAAGAVLTEKMDVNFFSEEWYRGTTRGVEVTALDIIAFCLIAASVLVPRYKSLPRIYWPGGLAFMALYALYCAFSVAISEPKIFGFFELTKILRGIMVFMAAALFVRTRRELFILILALGCAVSFEGAMAFKERYFYGMHRVTGSIDDPNSLSMYTCLVTPILVAAASLDCFPRWLRALCWTSFGAAALCILLTISRAGMPIFAFVMFGTTVFCVSWKPTFKKATITLLISLLTVAAVFKAWDMIMTRFEQATLAEEYLDDKNEGRGVYFRWAKAILHDHSFGVGLGNWSYWVSKVYGPDAGFPYLAYDDANVSPKDILLANAVYAAPAHNLAALTAGELGLPGLFLFGFVWARWFWMGFGFLWCRSNDPMRRLGIGLFFCVCGIFLQSVTEWVYRQTPIFLTFHVLVGTLASLHYHKHLEKRRLRQIAPVEERDDVIELNPDTSAMTREWR